jgi:sulfite reductase (ferredoxin)
MESPAELVKRTSRGLRGTIAEELAEDTPRFSKESAQLLKFHGIYPQTDRDARAAGGEPQHSAMVRVQAPGGVLTPDQYLALDRLADEAGDGGLRFTTRQDVQYHGVRKPDLKRLERALNDNLLSTFAACGDTVRNITCCPAPIQDAVHDQLQRHTRELLGRLKPKTRAYYEIWLDGEQAAAAEVDEPLFGPAYLPRKFKIGFAAPGENCIDVYTNDLGVVPVLEAGRLAAFTILAGGGMGSSPGVKSSHPKLAEPVCTIAPGDLSGVVEAVLTIHRDYGNRANRRLARLKYVIDDWGLKRFKQELDGRAGQTLAPPAPLEWSGVEDHLGWHEQGDGLLFLGIPVSCGRVRDLETARLRSGLRAVVERFCPGVRLTPQQNVLLTGLRPEDRTGIEDLLAGFGIRRSGDLLPVVRNALACPALPTCGLAVTEAERALGGITRELGAALSEVGLADQSISVRVTGCANGCARPQTAEIGVVGESVNLYGIYLGASAAGTRLGLRWAEKVPRAELATRLRPVFAAFYQRRAAGEAFGDFCHRAWSELL